MDEVRLAQAIEPLVGPTLAGEIAVDFVNLRRDAATGSLERISAGKFVESFVQCLQQISNGIYDAAPRVDHYLSQRLENETTLPVGLRLCGGRIARSIYTMRNKRNIAHKGEIDPNTIDLAFTHHAAAWIMAELIRCASGVSMEEAGAMISLVHAPVGTLVEEIDGLRMVHANVSVRAEILILLHSQHPDAVESAKLLEWIGKNPRATQSRVSELRAKRLIVGKSETGYRLTTPGYAAALEEIEELRT